MPESVAKHLVVDIGEVTNSFNVNESLPWSTAVATASIDLSLSKPSSRMLEVFELRQPRDKQSYTKLYVAAGSCRKLCGVVSRHGWFSPPRELQNCIRNYVVEP